MNTTSSWVALSAATVTVPASADGNYPTERLLVGFGQFVARRSGTHWTFRRRAHAIAAGTSEAILLERMADRLPNAATVIGWKVDQVLRPTLLGAAATAPPLVAHYAAARLHRLFRGGAVDLAYGRRAVGSSTLSALAADMAIYAPAWNADAVFSAWATGLLNPLRRDLGDEAVALWRLFVRTAGVAGAEAESATDAWFADRTCMQRAGRPRRQG